MILTALTLHHARQEVDSCTMGWDLLVVHSSPQAVDARFLG